MKRPYHHGDLRRALLEAAERAVEAGGVQNLSLRELSREIGVSYTAPRRHFASKQALLNALAVHGFEKLGAALAGAGDEPSVVFDARILQLAQAHIGFAREHPALMRLMFGAKHHPDVSAEVLEASSRALAIGPVTIEQGQAAGAVIPGDPDYLALTVFAAMEGLVAICAGGEFGGVPLHQLAARVVELLLVGLRPRS